MKYVVTFFCTLFVFLIFPVFGELAVAQNTNNTTKPISEYEDCSDSSITFEQSKKPLTKEERIALMEKAFFSSLNKFDRCQTMAASAASSSSSSSSRSGGASGSGAQSGGASSITGEMNSSETSDKSVASKEISGSDEEITSAEILDSSSSVQEDSKASQEKGDTFANGKVPDDIPPAQNDSILEAQIRAAAEAETDPVKKARLWNEYRWYKGIEIIEVEDDN